MKAKFLVILLAIVFTIELFSQPQSFKYQAVVRDGAGNILTNRSVSLRVTVHQSTAGGTVVYSETFSTSTNQFGMVSLQIGTGTPVSGSFSTIAWGAYDHFLQIEVDINGGTTYTDMGTAQLLSVPYALYAKESKNSSISDTDKDTYITTEKSANEEYIRFYTDGTERFRISPTGRLETTLNSIYFGNGAGKNNATSYNVIIGDSAAAMATGMTSSVAIGYRALYANTSGDYNSAFGALALSNNTTGNRNTGIGRASLTQNTSGSYNTSLGYYSLSANTSGNLNTSLGYFSLYNNTLSSNSCALGAYSLYFQTGLTATDTLNNVAVGNYSLYYNNPTLAGEACDNTGVGFKSLYKNSIGRGNVAIGNYALASNTAGTDNVAIGWQSLRTSQSAINNVAIGVSAGGSTSTGSGNVFVGYFAGNGNTTGGGNTYIGFGAAGSATISNAIAIGYNASSNASNKVVIGNVSNTTIGGYGAWTNYSDIRLKENLTYRNDLGLNFITKLKPASYNYINDINKTRFDGLIAQDVEKVLKELGLKFSGLVIDDDDMKTENLAYGQFVIPLITAVQELDNKNKNLEAQTIELKGLVQELLQQNKDLQERLEKLERKNNK